MVLSTKEDEVMEAPSLTVTEPDTSSLRSASDPECKNLKKSNFSCMFLTIISNLSLKQVFESKFYQSEPSSHISIVSCPEFASKVG